MSNEKLSQLKQMLSDGTISKEEFEQKKKELNLKESKLEQEKRNNKKTIIIVVSIIIIILIVCSIIATSSEKRRTDRILNTLNITQEKSEEKETGETTAYEVVQNFSEDGLSWVYTEIKEDLNSNDYYICINRNGESLIKYKEYDYEYAPDGIKEVTGFHNGICIITDGENKKKVIDKEGNVIIAEGDEACTKIISTDTTLGYIIVEKIDDSYKGTNTSYGVVDNQGNFVIPLSEDNAETFGQGELETVAKGIYRKGREIVNIETGAKVETGNEYGDKFINAEGKIIYCNKNLISDIVVYSSSDLKETARKNVRSIKTVGNYSDGKFYIEYEDENENKKRVFLNDNLETVADVSDLEITNVPVFKDGYAGLVIREKWYTVIDGNGKMQFEPADGTVCINLGNKKFYIESNKVYTINDEKNSILTQLKEHMKVEDKKYWYTDRYIITNLGLYMDTNGEYLKVNLKN